MSNKFVEISKALIVIWITITIALLGIAVSWGMMQKAVAENTKSIDQFHKVLYGAEGNSGLVKAIGNIESDIKWIRKSIETERIGDSNEEDG